MDDPRRFLPLTPQQFHILLALTGADRHGYGIIREVAARTGGDLRLGTGTLYTAIARLLASGLLADSSRRDEDARRRYYRLTPLGRVVLKAETARLQALVDQARRQGVYPLGRATLLRSR
jgi:DNA-binding PadR family transcriptional regulator